MGISWYYNCPLVKYCLHTNKEEEKENEYTNASHDNYYINKNFEKNSNENINSNYRQNNSFTPNYLKNIESINGNGSKKEN